MAFRATKFCGAFRRRCRAKQNGITVAFFAVDGTRTELDFLQKVYLAALEAGAAEIVVVDTIGACGPEAVEFLVREFAVGRSAGSSSFSRSQ